MRRISLFLFLTVVSLVSLIAVVIAGYYVLAATSSPYPNDWMGQMMGSGGSSMMGGTNGTQAQVQNNAVPYFGVAFVVLVAVAIIGIAGLVYFVAFPEIRVTQHLNQIAAQSIPTVQVPEKVTVAEKAASPYESVLKTLTEDERKVVQVLTTHEGKYLQKYIRKDAGLSRLQTHRIVARLAERGIVTLEKTGNTNTVILANWLK
jgi:uncharacterized membrane protein